MPPASPSARRPTTRTRRSRRRSASSARPPRPRRRRRLPRPPLLPPPSRLRKRQPKRVANQRSTSACQRSPGRNNRGDFAVLEDGIYGLRFAASDNGEPEDGSGLAMLRDGKVLGSDPGGAVFT